jgi:hypothetical protein
MEAPSHLLHTLSTSDHNSQRDHGRHIDMLHHSTIKHSRRHIPPTTFPLQVIETLQDDAFPVGETVSDVGEIGTRLRGTHVRFSLV